MPNGCQPVSDRHRRDLAFEVLHRLGDRLLGFSIECARRLVEDEEFRPGEQGSGNAKSLALAPADSHAILTDKGLEALAAVTQERSKVRSLKSLPHPVVINGVAREPKCDVVSHRAIRERHLLRHVRNPTRPLGNRQCRSKPPDSG